MSSRQSRASIVLNIGTNLLLPFVFTPASFQMRTEFLKGDSRGGGLSLFKNRSGQDLLKNLLLDDSHPPLANAGKSSVVKSIPGERLGAQVR